MNDKTHARREANYQRLAITINRWQTKLAKADATVQRSIRTLAKLEKQRRRMEKALAEPPRPRPAAVARIAPATPSEAVQAIVKPAEPMPAKPTPDAPRPVVEMEPIPTFLQRKRLDPVATEIKADQEEAKRAKTRGRIEKMKAKQRGDLKKMPLTGKAALDAIRNA